jgi:acyl-CoA reductase-like NAD-dependent aldehyde dehydrogenase
VLELGGNDPLIVMEDADLDKAAELAVQGATKNSGQRCTAVKRILVVEKVADNFAEAVAGQGEEAQERRSDGSRNRHRYRDPRARRAHVRGPRQRRGGQGRQAAARATTARVRSIPPPSSTMCPTPASWCTRRRSARSIPIIRCPNDIAEVIKISNATAYGLSSGVCTIGSITSPASSTSWRWGTVNIWEVPGYRIEMSPFGGIKDSGLGYKEGVWEAMKSYTNVKNLLAAMAGLSFAR